MTSFNELNRCNHCARHNWHENTHCSWCARPLPKPRHPWHNRIVVLVSIAAIVSVIYVGSQL